jgi:O-acetyl-ADP-ribose deacetylase (regulator of RNase III)
MKVERCCKIFGRAPYVNEGRYEFYPNRFTPKLKQNYEWATHEFGDILDWADKVDVIGHQVNCFGVMGGGLALQIAQKWPQVLTEYQEFIKEFMTWRNREHLMSFCQIVPLAGNCSIANLFGQYDTGGGRQTDYDSLSLALNRLRNEMLIQGMTKVALPVNLGCGLAGGDWNIVQSLIQAAFEGSDVQVILVEYKSK